MSRKAFFGFAFLGLVTFAAAPAAHAQFAVIDVASIAQLVQEVQMLQQELQVTQSQLQQAKSEYASITGTRGMQNLLSGTVRNYLPTDWAQVSQLAAGSPGSFPTLSGEVVSLLSANAVLKPSQVALLSPSQQAQLAAARQSPALLQTMARAALANASERFASLQQLIGAIGTSTDQKGALDLNARIAAEEGMLQNEATKLQVLFQVVQSQEWARAQQVREQALADQGSLRALPAMGL